MTPHPNSLYQYQVGGSLPPDSPTYVVREADNQLYNALLAREYCYVLNSRQMGKSSLRIQTMSKLEAQGIVCGEIELSGIGSQEITPIQWYGGIIQEFISGFGLKVNRRSWLQQLDDLSPVQRLGVFIEKVLLGQISQNIVIFIDEIDSILSLNFPTDEFLALIRNCYDKRATKPEYRRLTFALLGVATPSDLIQHKYATPFNIGRAIELKGFQIHESDALAQGLVGKVNNPYIVLKEILHWTGGQPFLTQKLCSLVQNCQVAIPVGGETQWVKQLVHNDIVSDWESQDQPEHLRTIRDRLLRNISSQTLLKLYRQVLSRGKITAKNQKEHLQLRLSGLVSQQRGSLVVKNRIYATVFNRHWVEQHLYNSTDLILLPLRTVIFTSLAIASLVIGVRSLGLLQPWELNAFDHLMGLRPLEGADKRLLLVTITEEDVQSQPPEEREGSSLSDHSLTQLLTKLEKYGARVIGLDIYRERRVKAEYRKLALMIQNSDKLFFICKYGSARVSPPPEVPPQRQGFNNVLLDSDQVIRRHLLAVSDASPCESQYALSWQLATRYLADKGIQVEFTDKYLKLGNTVFKTLEKNTGGYHNINASGHQVLLNYRATKEIAEKLTLQQILNNQFDTDLVKNRIVLIGTVAQSYGDHRWLTPYSKGWSVKTMTGVENQAYMVSDILSAVLDNRPLIWSLSQSGEIIWISSWSIVVGLLIWFLQYVEPKQNGVSSQKIILGGGTVLGILYGSCWLLLVVKAAWLPLLPSVLVLVGTVGSLVVLYRNLV